SVEAATEHYISLPPFTPTDLTTQRDTSLSTHLTPALTAPMFVPSPASQAGVSLNDAPTVLGEPPTFIRDRAKPCPNTNQEDPPPPKMNRPDDNTYIHRQGRPRRVPSNIDRMHIGKRPNSPSVVKRLVHLVSDILKKE
ncbi:MAG: hypothetical protein ACI9MC_001880, partial [Kiritimatiellia bacterium]